MAVNMSSMWYITTEVTNNTNMFIDLIVLGVILFCALEIGVFITNILRKTTKK